MNTSRDPFVEAEALHAGRAKIDRAMQARAARSSQGAVMWGIVKAVIALVVIANILFFLGALV